MIALAAIFWAMGMYGLFIGKLGAAFISFLCVPLMVHANNVFQEQDRQWLADPRNAATPKLADSCEALTAQESEASGSCL